MSDPTTDVRRSTYTRDDYRCAVCSSPNVTYQHRRAVGSGGSPIPPEMEDGLSLCGPHNEAAEHRLQTAALYYGWKVRRWVQDPSRVPVFYLQELAWYRLEGKRRILISPEYAQEMMLAVYGDQYDSWEVRLSDVVQSR